MVLFISLFKDTHFLATPFPSVSLYGTNTFCFHTSRSDLLLYFFLFSSPFAVVLGPSLSLLLAYSNGLSCDITYEDSELFKLPYIL